MWRCRATVLASALSLALLAPSAARAQSASDPATARVLFGEGRKLMAAKRYAEACPKFEESLRLDSGIGAMYNLADCWEKSGRTASAWAMFLDTAAAARAANQADRAKVAKSRASELEPKLARLTIRVASPSAGLEVKRDGQVVAAASYDMPVPVDPGTHRVEVSAPGKKPFASSVDVSASGNASLQIPQLEDAPAAGPVASAPSASPATASPAQATTAAPSEASPADRHPSKVLPFALIGVGVAGLAVGTVFEVMSRGKNSDALGICAGDSACQQSDIDKHDGLVRDAKTDNLVALVAAGVGAASAITGVVLLLSAPSTEKAARSTPATHFAFGVGPQGASVLAKGSF